MVGVAAWDRLVDETTMSERQRVYVLRVGDWEGVRGVYATPEAAMAAYPAPEECWSKRVPTHVCGWHPVPLRTRAKLGAWMEDCGLTHAYMDEYEVLH